MKKSLSCSVFLVALSLTACMSTATDVRQSDTSSALLVGQTELHNAAGQRRYCQSGAVTPLVAAGGLGGIIGQQVTATRCLDEQRELGFVPLGQTPPSPEQVQAWAAEREARAARRRANTIAPADPTSRP